MKKITSPKYLMFVVASKNPINKIQSIINNASSLKKL